MQEGQVIQLTQGRIALVDAEDYATLSQYKWCFDGLYAVRRSNASKIYMHRVIACTPSSLVTDHINGDKLDNRRKNLRACSHRENMLNRGATRANKTGLKGAYFDARRGKWYANITRHGKAKRLGSFATAQQAHEAYMVAAGRVYQPTGKSI